jgi:spectinomycin phosphotransferase
VRAPDETALRDALLDGYGFAIERLAVEGDGVDATAWAWTATTTGGRALFVKARQEVRPAAMLVPRHLRTIGFEEVVAALPTIDGAAWLEVDGWTVVVMDLVDGPTAFRAGLDLDGWRRLGAFSARLHAVELPADLAAIVRVEDFRSEWPDRARSLDARIDGLDVATLDEPGRAVRRRWIAERATIRRIVDLDETLSGRIRARPAADRGPHVLCHADFHAANVLVDRSGALHVVDWDELVLAPRERDLMFVRGSVVAGTVTEDEADAFEAGYGPVAIDRERLAWYRIDWAVQDIAGFAEEILLDPEPNPRTRPRARRIFEALFGPADEAAGALAIARELGLEA